VSDRGLLIDSPSAPPGGTSAVEPATAPIVAPVVVPTDAAAVGTDWLASLNTEQRRAVEHGLAPLLVIAGAGSGKTNTLAHRVAQLVGCGVDPRSILLLTFSRRAAVSMTRRVEHITARRFGKRASVAQAALTWSGTFHSVGARLLREYAELIGLAPSFTIADREDAADLMNLVRHELRLGGTEKRFPTKHTCFAIYSRVVNTEAALGAVLRTAFPWCANWEAELRKLFAGYVAAKQAQHVLDYDDLLLYWSHMMAEPSIAGELGARFSHVLVDEYQDTNRLQSTILRGLKPDGQGLTVVGDDAQSIYSFRGATVRNILDFPLQFEPPAISVALERNYRSTQPILAASNAVMDRASERFTKNLWSDRAADDLPRLVTVPDEADQARYVAETVLANREMGHALKSQAVLFRTSHHSAPLEIELARRNIPFVKFGGLKFLDSSHVKDLLSVLRWAENPRDRVAGFRVAQLLPGVGLAIAGRLLDEIAAPFAAATASDAPVAAVDIAAVLAAFPVPPRVAAAWPAFVELLCALRTRSAPWPAEVELARRWYEPHLQRLHEDAQTRCADLLQLEQIAAGFATRERFLTELTLDPPDATSGEAGVPLRDEDYLILSTIHSAKGQEWRSVFLLNAVDGCLPADLSTGSTEELDEERRLLYVAMTRAKDQLDIMVPQRFYVHQQAAYGDRHVYASRTRFLPPGLLALFENAAWPPAPAELAAARGFVAPAIDVGAKLRRMWT
jgi:DNA helicase-2/ATP-dependent DNA helicase PcrA